jgi:hypothetical protein
VLARHECGGGLRPRRDPAPRHFRGAASRALPGAPRRGPVEVVDGRARPGRDTSARWPDARATPQQALARRRGRGGRDLRDARVPRSGAGPEVARVRARGDPPLPTRRHSDRAPERGPRLRGRRGLPAPRNGRRGGHAHGGAGRALHRTTLRTPYVRRGEAGSRDAAGWKARIRSHRVLRLRGPRIGRAIPGVLRSPGRRLSRRACAGSRGPGDGRCWPPAPPRDLSPRTRTPSNVSALEHRLGTRPHGGAPWSTVP